MKIIDNILEIRDQENNAIEIQDIKLEFSCNKYSSKKNSIYHISLNGKHLSKKSKCSIKYKCVTCENIHIVGVTQFIRKIQKCSHRCYVCCNKDEEKREQHREFYENYNADTKEEKPKLSLQELHDESLRLFDEYDGEFKDNYFKYHLTIDDYKKRISKCLISLQNGKHMISDDIEFWPIFKTNNQMLFSSVFYDKVQDMIIRVNQPILKCENCQSEWRAKTLEKYKNCYKIMCNNCTLCNKTYKIRPTKNNINKQVLYQSKLELKFIEWCNNTNLTVYNGPSILYDFEGKQHKYKVDFQVADILIEIKDNHIWHNNQLASGKCQAKEAAVAAEIAAGKYKEYYLITPKNWVYSLNKLKNQLTK